MQSSLGLGSQTVRHRGSISAGMTTPQPTSDGPRVDPKVALKAKIEAFKKGTKVEDGSTPVPKSPTVDPKTYKMGMLTEFKGVGLEDSVIGNLNEVQETLVEHTESTSFDEVRKQDQKVSGLGVATREKAASIFIEDLATGAGITNKQHARLYNLVKGYSKAETIMSDGSVSSMRLIMAPFNPNLNANDASIAAVLEYKGASQYMTDQLDFARAACKMATDGNFTLDDLGPKGRLTQVYNQFFKSPGAPQEINISYNARKNLQLALGKTPPTKADLEKAVNAFCSAFSEVSGMVRSNVRGMDLNQSQIQQAPGVQYKKFRQGWSSFTGALNSIGKAMNNGFTVKGKRLRFWPKSGIVQKYELSTQDLKTPMKSVQVTRFGKTALNWTKHRHTETKSIVDNLALLKRDIAFYRQSDRFGLDPQHDQVHIRQLVVNHFAREVDTKAFIDGRPVNENFRTTDELKVPWGPTPSPSLADDPSMSYTLFSGFEASDTNIKQLVENGTSLANLKKMDYTPKQLLDSGKFNVQQLLSEFSVQDLLGDVSISALREGGVQAGDLTDFCSAYDLKEGGFTATDLKPHFDVDTLAYECNFNRGQLEAAGVTERELTNIIFETRL